jgi:hypothetical protein
VRWARGVREFGVEDVLTLHDDGWYDAEGAGWEKNSLTLARSITGFEVLAEPRAVTAKAVLERVRQEGLIQLALAANPRNGDAFDAIARDFGVES